MKLQCSSAKYKPEVATGLESISRCKYLHTAGFVRTTLMTAMTPLVGALDSTKPEKERGVSLEALVRRERSPEGFELVWQKARHRSRHRRRL